jgi:hypothetical protein
MLIGPSKVPVDASAVLPKTAIVGLFDRCGEIPRERPEAFPWVMLLTQHSCRKVARGRVRFSFFCLSALYNVQRKKQKNNQAGQTKITVRVETIVHL